jgi:hypothetical protein
VVVEAVLRPNTEAPTNRAPAIREVGKDMINLLRGILAVKDGN